MQPSAVPPPPAAARGEVTTLLREWSAGDAEAPARLMPLVYEHLRALARTHLRDERAGHTLQPTALVHEAFLRLVGSEAAVGCQDRTHFFRVAARMMRRILVDHARAGSAGKRGGPGQQKVALLDVAEFAPQEGAAELLALDEALGRLAETYPRPSEVVELKFFGGLESKEIAEALEISVKTVVRHWTFAKHWLYREIERAAHGGDLHGV